MKVLIVGGGGREHAIAVSMRKSSRVEKLYCVPGNAGIAQIAECEPSIGVMEFDRIVDYAREKAVDLVFVAPDDPLVGGLVDALQAAGIRTFGPDQKAAILEGSKAFSKDLMKKYHIPTADYETFDDPKEALRYLETARMPIVLKADGLALGKGVLIPQNFA
ncbi:MAG: phosphoribosylamine--glycine ligase, partial [Acetatifactor sp.]|nr:phosphoribosylamine--glycine ligase [Acetatifactor sp.]